MINMLNPWIILGVVAALIAWTALVYNHADTSGFDRCDLGYKTAAQEQQDLENEVSDEISEERQVIRKDINKSTRKIKNDAKELDDSIASNRLQSISRGLHERWKQDHQ